MYWKKRLSPAPAFAPLEIVEARSEPSPPPTGIVSIWLANGISLEVPPTVTEADLARMVRVLSAC